MASVGRDFGGLDRGQWRRAGGNGLGCRAEFRVRTAPGWRGTQPRIRGGDEHCGPDCRASVQRSIEHLLDSTRVRALAWRERANQINVKVALAAKTKRLLSPYRGGRQRYLSEWAEHAAGLGGVICAIGRFRHRLGVYKAHLAFTLQTGDASELRSDRALLSCASDGERCKAKGVAEAS